jgi:glutamyl-tRNA synthetase
VVPRLRFAPSPTGYLHVGGARTALFNWLYARRHGGVFVLRIEDTDAERSSWDMVEGIVDGMRWLGLDWDEGPDVGGGHAPYFQSQRLDRYRAVANRLVDEGRAYFCYCNPDELKARREASQAGEGWRYDRRCLRLSPEQIAGLEATGAPRAIRFRVPEWPVRFDDLVRGPIEFDHASIEDFVILRSDQQPTYQLSVVVDDVEMGITDVVRGEDHISNTPKQALLYEALGAPLPRFAHVPLILGPDKKRLSKRHGATSVTEYRRLGYLPEAMVNFLALLGWSPATGQELFTREELIAAFALEGISGGNAVFDSDKLDWFNSQHLARLSPAEAATRVEPFLREAGLWRDSYAEGERAWFVAAIQLLIPRARRLTDFAEHGRYFFDDAFEYDAAAARKHLAVPDLEPHIAALRAAFERLQEWRASEIEAALRQVAEARGTKAATLIHPTRIATSGTGVGPSLFDLLAVLGRDRTVARLRRLESWLAVRTTA